MTKKETDQADTKNVLTIFALLLPLAMFNLFRDDFPADLKWLANAISFCLIALLVVGIFLTVRRKSK